MLLYKFSIRCYNEINQVNEDIQGLVLAQSYPNAMENIEKYYGENNLLCVNHLEDIFCGNDIGIYENAYLIDKEGKEYENY